jgi:hypothetical protein
MAKIHFTPLKYLSIFTFASKVSNVTLNPLKLSNCHNLTHLAFLFSKCPHQIFFLKKKKIQEKKEEKTKKIYKYMLGWFGWWPDTYLTKAP